MKKLLITTILSLAIMISISAQSIQRDVICVNGNYVNNGDIRISQTIGEPIAETFNGPDITTLIVQGFEQQFGNLVTVGIFDLEYDLNIYPNPTYNYVYLNFQQKIPENLSVQVYGVEGKLFGSQKLLRNTRVDLQKLASGSYFLKVVDDHNQHLKTIQIVKLK